MLGTLQRPKTLKETALEKLREAITLGEFKPGERLVERALCERLGVSRTVIRECIRHLESEWLVTVVPNSGPSVAVPDAEMVQEIYEIRALLETAAVRACAVQATDKVVEQLKRGLDEIGRLLEAGKVDATLARTRKFYETIFTAGGKAVSWELVERLNGRISQLRALTLSSEGRGLSGPENLRTIVAAIERRDPEAAAEACNRHIAEASWIALAELNNQNNPEEIKHG